MDSSLHVTFITLRNGHNMNELTAWHEWVYGLLTDTEMRMCDDFRSNYQTAPHEKPLLFEESGCTLATWHPEELLLSLRTSIEQWDETRHATDLIVNIIYHASMASARNSRQMQLSSCPQTYTKSTAASPSPSLLSLPIFHSIDSTSTCTSSVMVLVIVLVRL